jgi:hypothetical protein
MTTTTADRELLALAAEAAGYIVRWVDGVTPMHYTGYMRDTGTHNPVGFEHEVRWNPLTDDGDAFRLTATLKMEVYHADDEGEAAYASYVKPNSAIAYCIEYYDDICNMGNQYAATRRAIVRAAAEMGKLI